MAKAEASSSVASWPAEGLPFDPARVAPQLWDDYVAARAVARDVPRILFITPSGSTSRTPDEERRVARLEQAKAALHTRLRAYLKEEGRELYARHGSSAAPAECVLVSIDDLQFDHEGRAAKVGALTFYGLHERLTQATAPPARTTSEKRKAGAKPEFDWDVIQAFCNRTFAEEGYPDNVSAFCRDVVLPWCEERFGKEGTPEMETLRPQIGRWVDAWLRLLPLK